eukprot:CAMPEP_0172425574 /NCGR_PEP_ID=MMETSP1064-20121228/32758_1 /TAXON_ID=202472 /ORGANISM="Aulacoseira subarctica , Strain CCAP 1002/5" /LENGTH=322 /DNA_ID=CAMNT_0013168547 /DNA_START=275 /DNA_END=1243 /DNA_ORIENTATION=+
MNTSLNPHNNSNNVVSSFLRQEGASRNIPFMKNQTKKIMQTGTTPWIEHFVSSNVDDALLKIPRDFIEDNFNFHKIPQMVEEALSLLVDANPNSPNTATVTNSNQNITTYDYSTVYREALKMILDKSANIDMKTTNCSSSYCDHLIPVAAKIIYCYLHARFVSSQRGLDIVRRMLRNGTPMFGRCPKINCQGMRLLPYGISDVYGRINPNGDANANFALSSSTLRYCCSCGEVCILNWSRDNRKSANGADGCAWGPSFCHLFLMTHGKDFDPRLLSSPGDGKVEMQHCHNEDFTRPTRSIFGFQMHPSAPCRYPILQQQRLL